jgi:hypothetical protein
LDRDTRRLKAILTFTAALAFAAAPFLAPGFEGFDPEAFPVPQRDPPVQPAGFAFAIWGPIYLWLLAHAGWGLFARADDAEWDRPRWPLFASLALGASWLAVAGQAPLVATVQIWAMLVFALLALFRISPDREPLLLAAPVALYAGWLTAAAFVALGLVLAGHGLVSEATAAALCLAGAVALGLAVQIRLSRAPLFGAALVWALIGVAVSNAGRAPALALLAVLGGVAVGLSALRAVRQGL